MPIIRWLSFISLAFFLTRNGKYPQKKLNGSHNSADPTYRKQPSRSSEPAYEKRWHPQEEKHRRHEGRYWLATSILSAVVAVGAGLSAIYAYRAVKAGQAQAEIARQSLISSNRAWLQTIAIKDSRIDVVSGGIFFSANITVKNIGHSPAEHVFPSAALRIAGADQDIEVEEEIVCKNAVQHGYPAFNGLIFPDEVKSLSVDAITSVANVKRTRVEQIDREFPYRADAFGPDFAERYKRRELSLPIRIEFKIVGCITYQNVVGPIIGQTAFVYNVGRACSSETLRGCDFDINALEGVDTEIQVLITESEFDGLFAK